VLWCASAVPSSQFQACTGLLIREGEGGREEGGAAAAAAAWHGRAACIMLCLMRAKASAASPRFVMALALASGAGDSWASEITRELFHDDGSPEAVAAIFFVSYMLIASIVLINVIIAVCVQ